MINKMLFTWVAVLADYFFVLIEYGGLNSTVSYIRLWNPMVEWLQLQNITFIREEIENITIIVIIKEL